MLDTFKARLKAVTKAAGVNLSKKRLDAMATKLHTKYPDVTEEAEHDTHINDVYDVDIFKEIKALDDYQRTLEAQSATETEEAKPETAQAKPAVQAKPKPADDMPEWFKQYKAETDAKLSAFEKDKTVGTIKQRLKETLKDVPKDFYEEWQLPESEDALEAFAEKVNTKYTAFKQDLVNQGLAVQTKPGGGNGGGKGDTMSKEQVKSLNDKLMPKN